MISTKKRHPDIYAVLNVLEWHSGQTDPVYAIGSSYLAFLRYNDSRGVDKLTEQHFTDALYNLSLCKPFTHDDARSLEQAIRTITALKGKVK